MQQLIHRNGTEVIRAWFQPMDDQQLSYLLRFITYGLIGLIREWFQKNMDLPKEETGITMSAPKTELTMVKKAIQAEEPIKSTLLSR